MNNRIQEIANQVERIRDLYNIGPVHRDAVEQFAELIVKECIAIARMNDDETFSDADGRARTILREIKEHFGVE